MNTTLDLATVISLIWGLVSVIIFRFVPAKGTPMVLISYLAPVVVVAVAVLAVDGTAGFSWQKYLIDVFAAYAANQATFQAAKAAGLPVVTPPPSGPPSVAK